MGILLSNRYLEAEFDERSGALRGLRRADENENLVEGSFCRILNRSGSFLLSGQSGEASIDRGFRVEPFRSVAVEAISERSVRIINHADELEIEQLFELEEDSRLLRLGVTVRRTGADIEYADPMLPRIELASLFTDAFLDDKDLYFDGEELSAGRELPCWRVFFQKGHARGLIAAARSKFDMARLRIFERALAIHPDMRVAYDTHLTHIHQAFMPEGGVSHAACMEIGPWSKEEHGQILAQADLLSDREVSAEPPTGVPPEIPDDHLFDATAFAGEDEACETFSPEKWMIADMPWCRGERALFCGSSVQPPVLRLNPGLQGVCRVHVGIGNGNGIRLRFSDEPLWTYRIPDAEENRTPFWPMLSGEHKAREVTFKVADLGGRILELARLPNRNHRTVIDYVRFEKLSDAEAQAWAGREAREPCTILAGLNDTPDIAPFTDPADPDPQAYRANLWEHAECGVKRVYWRVDGQCSDFPSRINTMRYICARVHGVFNPASKAYGRALRKVDMLALARDAAREYGLELYGWMRFNSYGGNVQSDFFRNHPQYHEEYENGIRANKLCLAFPEVRAHKIGILLEAARYGLAGLCLGFLRHPPVLSYAPVLVHGYEEEFGVKPPRAPDAPDPVFRKSIPPDDAQYRRWYAYRARYLTLFMRELKDALKAEGLQSLRIAIWVRANHCLFDGIDLPVWLEDGLCDEVIADNYADASVCEPAPEWKNMVQKHAALLRGISWTDYDHAEREVPRILDEGYDGICTYESDYAVLDSRFIGLYHGLRQ